jgi:hypothetical protein
MKISICSDLHLEFGDIELSKFDNVEGAQVLVLGGDITVSHAFTDKDVNMKSAALAARTHALWAHVNSKYDSVIYIMGNHEHYHGDFAETEHILRKELEQYEHIYFLEKEWLTIPEGTSFVTFVAGTLWTNFDGHNEDLMRNASRCMNDYRGVTNSSRFITSPNQPPRAAAFSPQDSYDEHNLTFDTISHVVDSFKDGKIVVCTHHAPTQLSKRPDEWDDSDMHYFYNSDLEEFIKNNPNIVLWTHGHTHAQYEHNIGNALVACNPRGYIGYQEIANYFELKTYEI